MEYQCPDCPYVYNEEAGDPDNGVSPGTKFEDLPASWVCPICGSEKTGFEQQEWTKPASLDHKLTTKTGMSYIVAAPIAKFLERIRVITKYKKMDDYIFTNQDSGKQNVETLYVNVLGRDYDQEGLTIG